LKHVFLGKEVLIGFFIAKSFSACMLELRGYVYHLREEYMVKAVALK
jgi:hypothetical protein